MLAETPDLDQSQKKKKKKLFYLLTEYIIQLLLPHGAM